ncbi:hypothetical protein F5H01DRAFT_405424 [Linnemannia elongata]|nr:hypothetical protein F5H01DRAFT_405424 [Linnemannia elongata]
MPPSTPSFTLRCDTNNDRRNALASNPSQDEYNRIYTRDSEIYANCESEEDADDDDENYISPALQKRRNKTLGLNTNKGERFERMFIQPLIDSPDLPELPDEVLELVCTYLSQETLRYSVNQVCKKWHNVSDRLIRRVGGWKPVEGALELLLNRWSWINCLELQFNQEVPFYWTPVYVTIRNPFWNALVSTITEPKEINNQGKPLHDNDHNHDDDDTDPNGYGDKDQSAPSCLLHSIRHIEVRGLYMFYSEVVSDLRGHLQFIESLTINTRSSPEHFPLFTILKDFPALRSFNLTLRAWGDVDLTHGDDEDKNEATAIFVDGSPKMFPERYQLQRFFVDDISTDLKVLERLLVTCPDLRVFNAKDVLIALPARFQVNEKEERVLEDRKARQRLIDLAAKHCPKLEWYSFHTYRCASNKDDLRAMARNFPDQKMQSIVFPRDLDDVFDDALGLQDQLEEITVLEIYSNLMHHEASVALNRILCLTPNLLHLIAPDADLNSRDLWRPPAPVVKPTKKRVFAPVRHRKRHHRNARQRRARELALTESRSTAPAADVDTSAADVDTSVAVTDPSIPVTWQVYNLKTLELCLRGDNSLVDLADYISRYRLFRNLVTLTLHNWELKVGQRQALSNVPAAVVSDGYAETLLEPARYPNELLALRCLRCLEEFTLRAGNVPGMISAKNFEFLKRTESFQTVSFLPVDMNGKKWEKTKNHRNNKPVLETMTATDDDDDDDDDNEDDNDDNDADIDKDEEVKEEEDEKEWKDETFWPKLSTFHISYRKISTSSDTRKLVRRLQYLRPGVAFIFQSRDPGQ